MSLNGRFQLQNILQYAINKTMSLNSSRPIGIFDSGIGGLTVAKAIVEVLPKENIVYFGDTAHLPYGDKSSATIQEYSLNIVKWLLKRQCKLILIACNSASAAAYEVVKKAVAGKVLVMDVIDPLVNFVVNQKNLKKIGLIATKQTVNSNIYQKEIAKRNSEIEFCALATPLLVPVIEEGYQRHQIIDVLLAEYLSHPNLQNLDALILGCTHYPVIKESIAKHYRGLVKIIDGSHIVADEVRKQLQLQNLLNQNSGVDGERQFYVSDYTEPFVAMTKLFFGQEVLVSGVNDLI